MEARNGTVTEERERLRAAGYTEDEVSRILIGRKVGATPQPAATANAAFAGGAFASNEPQKITISSSIVSEFVATVWGKILTILAAISILIGIVIEIQSLFTGYYALKKASADAEISEVTAKYAPMKTSADAAISEVNAQYARAVGKYP